MRSEESGPTTSFIIPKMHSILDWHTVTAAFLILIIVTPASCQCYYPDGKTLAPDLPCNSTASTTPCCNAGNMCLDNGLCLGNGIVSRGSCTDKNWGDGCPSYCQSNNPDGGEPLQPCDPFHQIWVCGWNSSGCLTNTNTFVMTGGNGVILRSNQVAGLENGPSQPMLIEPDTTISVNSANASSTTPSTSSTASASSTSASSASSSTSSSTSSSESSSASSTAIVSQNRAAKYTAGDMAGVGVGVGAPLLSMLVAACVMILRLRKQLRKAQPASAGGNPAHPYDAQQPLYAHAPMGYGYQQTTHSPPIDPKWNAPGQQSLHLGVLQGQNQTLELQAEREAQELANEPK